MSTMMSPPLSPPPSPPQRRRQSFALLATLVAGAFALYLCAVLRPSQDASRLTLRVGSTMKQRLQRRDNGLGKETFFSSPAEAAAEEVAAADALLPLLRSSSAAAAAASSSSSSSSSSTATRRRKGEGEPRREGAEEGRRRRRPLVHVIATSNGSPYLNYQTRILHASWRRTREKQRREERETRESSNVGGGDGDKEHAPWSSPLPLLRGFTRILHRTTDDPLSDEVPTLRVSPRTPACDEWCPFPVADRPEAVRSFFAAVRSRGAASVPAGEEELDDDDDEEAVGLDDDLYYFYLVETDYVFLRPPPVPIPTAMGEGPPPSPPSSLSTSSLSFDGLAFPFSYIEPANDLVVPILERLFAFSSGSDSSRSSPPSSASPSSSKGREKNEGGAVDVAAVPNTGPAPVLLPLRHWLRLLPRWVAFAEAVEADLRAREVMGWVREMYAFSCAAAASGVKLGLVAPSLPPLISQPPEDELLGDASAIHYTWGTRIVEIVAGEGGEQEEHGERQERLVWEFDKRKITGADAVEQLPRPVPLPEPFDPRWRLAGSKAAKTRENGSGSNSGWKRGKLVTKALYESLNEQVREINAAIDWIQEREGKADRKQQQGGE